MLRVITLNLNGIRAAIRKGLFEWLAKENADVICVQEIKAQEADLQHDAFQLAGYYGFFHYAEKKGYSGVAIYSKQKPNAVKIGLGWSVADQEGRYVEADFGGLHIASLYLPSGTSGDHRQMVKFDFLKNYTNYLEKIMARGESTIICGDFNIAHKEIDLKNWRANQKCSGFLPEERAWMDHLFEKMGFIDAFRQVNSSPDEYTWWSNFGQAWAKNVGWRIDYQVTTPDLQSKIQSAKIYKDQRFSDHAPVIIDYKIPRL
jgi:exodeoxyribonuclease-3